MDEFTDDGYAFEGGGFDDRSDPIVEEINVSAQDLGQR